MQIQICEHKHTSPYVNNQFQVCSVSHQADTHMPVILSKTFMRKEDENFVDGKENVSQWKFMWDHSCP